MTRKPSAVSLKGKTPSAQSPAKPSGSSKGPRKPRVSKVTDASMSEDVFDHPSTLHIDEVPTHLPVTGGNFRWGVLFVVSVTALLSFGIGLWLTSTIEAMFARSEWLGWIASGLAVIATIALALFILGEIAAVWRLRKLGKIRENVQNALESGTPPVKHVLHSVIELYQTRRDMDWNVSRFTSHAGEIMDDRDRLILAERTLMKPLDYEAKGLIASSSKRIAVVTAVNPAPSLDVLFTGFQILRMLRQITVLYGSRPGTIGTFRLARMVGSHLAITGGLALSDSLLQQFIGKGIAGRLSAKLGEGTVNGIMTVRIGLAAMELCRPMPFHAIEKPGLREFLSVIAGTVTKTGY